MEKTIKIDSEVYTKLLAKKNQLITEQGGKNITFSSVIGRVLENA